jgi:hypothetical protein
MVKMFLLPTTLLAIGWLGIVQAAYPVTGVQDDVTPKGPRPARQNIETLQGDSYAWYALNSQPNLLSLFLSCLLAA